MERDTKQERKMNWYVKQDNQPVKEVYESFNGDLYFVIEKVVEGFAELSYGFVRLYSMPECAEWGDFPNFEQLKKEYGEYKIWKVKKENWANINSYEKGLLNYRREHDRE